MHVRLRVSDLDWQQTNDQREARIQCTPARHVSMVLQQLTYASQMLLASANTSYMALALP
jgi:hypothetical protein